MRVYLIPFTSKTHPFSFLQQRAEGTQPPAEDPLAGTETQGEGQNAQGGQQQEQGQGGQDNGGTVSPGEGDSGNGQQQNSLGDGGAPGDTAGGNDATSGDGSNGGDDADPPVGEGDGSDDAADGEAAQPANAQGQPQPEGTATLMAGAKTAESTAEESHACPSADAGGDGAEGGEVAETTPRLPLTRRLNLILTRCLNLVLKAILSAAISKVLAMMF